MLGPITVPDPPLIAPFPLNGEYGSGMDWTPNIAVHVFDQPGLKTEQRYVIGSGARRFRVRKDHLSCDEYDNLKAHWEQAQGVYAYFPYQHPSPSGMVSFNVHYENPNLTFEQLTGLITGDPGVTLIEVPAVTPSYLPSNVVTSFHD